MAAVRARGGAAVVNGSGDAAAGPRGPGEDAVAIVRLFACLACEGDDIEPLRGDAAGGPPSGEHAGAGTAYRLGVRAGRRVEQELVARLVAMAARRDRRPVPMGYDAARVADPEYRRGLVAGRRLVHGALLVSWRMAHGEACPACGATGINGHDPACCYA
ncbi:hypothetical protein GCM10009661_75960 [Catellatospora chokoriensis]|uniref:Uncharacterized protein n=1 Tax=Catellatospora chokoriensis TaxID=310353 RepID=A0A8J3NW18_9ACTN|nr:hypothetical protein Cch02nite_79100 [Catellatospora chokoriensis]